MRIVYMGTPDIAVPTLRFLAESKHEVVGVLTQPDRPKGRGHHTIPTPVKAAALEYDIPVYQPLSLRKGEDAAAALETLRQLAPDLIVVLDDGKISGAGTHDQLMASNHIYQEVYKSQQEGATING